MEKTASIFVAGHRGLVGSALVRELSAHGYSNLVLKGREEVDLTRQSEVEHLFSNHQIDCVLLAAAKVGGILYNQTHQADFLYENLQIAANVVHSAATHGVKKLVYLGSSCIYPKHATQPISEDALLTGALEPTNEAYAIAKIAGLKLCEKYFTQYGKRFVAVMPTNLYGPNDNFHPERSHVIPALMRRFHEAKIARAPEVVIWGTGSPMREFLHVDDLARAVRVVMECYESSSPLNIGTGEDCSIAELAALMKETVGYEGAITFDTTKPDGTPRKVLNVARMKSLGWEPQRTLDEGLRETYQWALRNGVFQSDLREEHPVITKAPADHRTEVTGRVGH
jgi:GDP-L-fucose synthase